ncbi:MAG TPA: peptidylprolyl isomerase [Bryobacteraceae bacterium]|nr:peptidylprolyl isomerase [Bryobacteraceae bacterium]
MILVPWYVNGDLVDDALVREEAARMRPQYMESVGEMDPIEAEMQLREWARDNVIERMLLKSAAFADPEPVPAEVIEKGLEAMNTQAGGKVSCGTRTSDDNIREQIETQYRIERLIHHVHSAVPAPKPKDIAELYKRNKSRFMTPELVHAAHIVKNIDEQHDEATARVGIESAMADLKSGIPFGEAADRHSDCAGNGGDLGWFPRGQMVEEFDNVVFNLPVGSRSDIFRSPFGFHIAMVIERRAEGIRAFKEIENEITAHVWQEKRQKALEEYLDELRAKAEIRQGKAAQ